MKFKLCLLLYFSYCTAIAQEVGSTLSSTKTLSNIFTIINQNVPKDHTVLDTVFGDLNSDEYQDVIVVLKRIGEDTLAGPKRPLLIFAGNKNNKLNFTERNDDVVLCKECGGVFGDPYEGITIKNGYFSVEHYGGSAWRWTRIITFKYSPKYKTWLLHKDGGSYYHTINPENGKTTIYTVKDFGTVIFKDFHNEDSW